MKIEADALKTAGIRHGFFTRRGGVSEGIYGSLNIGLGSDDDRDKVLENRHRVAAHFGLSAEFLVSPHQVHSADVIPVSGPWTETTDRKADALVTKTPGVCVGVATADCGPVLFADPDAGVVGAAHAGWKGAVSGILENTVSAMETLGAAPENIVAVLGPTISQEAYEVGPEFFQRFIADSSDNNAYFVSSGRKDHYKFNLPEFIIGKLKKLGLSSATTTGHCTYKSPEDFYSYRRTTHHSEPDYGRQISVITLQQT